MKTSNINGANAAMAVFVLLLSGICDAAEKTAPVHKDMIGYRRATATGSVSTASATTFTSLPLWDSPILLAERSQVPLKDGE